MIQSSDRSPSNLLQRAFLDHPESVEESYLEHLQVALGFAFWLGLAALAAVVHALMPALCEKTASRIVTRLYARLSSRSAQAAANQ